MGTDPVQLAKALYRAKQTSQTPDNTLVSEQRKKLQDRLVAHKQLILSAMRANNKQLVAREVRTLIAIRAEQLSLTLDELQTTYGKIDDAVLEKHILSYYTDCYELVRTIHA